MVFGHRTERDPQFNRSQSRSAARVQSESLFSYVDLERRVRPDHTPRAIRTIVNEVLLGLPMPSLSRNLPSGRSRSGEGTAATDSSTNRLREGIARADRQGRSPP